MAWLHLHPIIARYAKQVEPGCGEPRRHVRAGAHRGPAQSRGIRSARSDRAGHARSSRRSRCRARHAPRPVRAENFQHDARADQRALRRSVAHRSEEDVVQRARSGFVQHPRGARRSRHRAQQGCRRRQRQARSVRHRRRRLAVATVGEAQEHLPLHRDQHECGRRSRQSRVRGGQRHARHARPALDPDGPRAGARHGRVDERQVRRPRHRDQAGRSHAARRAADARTRRASKPAITSSRSTTS
jgi:hypothetical protein